MPRPRCRGPEAWPDLDRELYKNCEQGSRRSGQRQYQSLSARTRRGIELDYETSLRWLVSRGLLDPCATPAVRWPFETLEAMAVEMLDAGYSVASIHTRVGRLKRAVKAMQPGADLGHFDDLLREFERPKPRFDPIVWRVSSADLWAFGIELMTDAAAITPPGIEQAALYCCGLQTALIACRPWRKTQFSIMELWTNLCREGEGWRMRAHRHETKQRRYQSARIPSKLVPFLEAYIASYRPILCKISGYTGDALWLNARGLPMTPSQLLKSFTHLTEKKFAERITLHATRKIAATTMAVHNPREVHAIQGILGHAKHRTGEKYYNLASSLSAHADLDRTMNRLGRKLRDKKRRRLRS